MAFNFKTHALVDSATLSKFFWGVDDASVDLSAQDKFSIELAINAISSQIIRHCSSNIKQGTYLETWDGAASDELVPTEMPITAVASVKFAGAGDFASAQPLPAEVVTFDRYSIKLRGLRMPQGRGVVQVSYTAGYAEVPDDVVMATLLQFQWTYKQLGKGDSFVGIKSISKGSESQTKDDVLARQSLRSEVVGILAPYVRLEAPGSIMFTRVS